MRARIWRFSFSLLALLALAFLTACGGSSSSGPSNAVITLQAQYEKRPLTPSGFGPLTLRPTRYCWAEIRETGSNALLASGYLGSDGTGTASVPRGLSIYVRVFADYQIPAADPNSFFMRGNVKNSPDPITPTSPYISSNAFSNIPVWSVTSNSITANQDGTLGVTALASNRIAGAFNIADQAVTFAAAVRDMDGASTFRLPNLHTFWTTSVNPSDQDRSYPEIVRASANSLLVSDKGRALFHHSVYGLGTGTPNTETDEWDDSVLQETFARLLFADHSYKADGSSSLSLLRRDNDNVWVDRTVPAESTAAFVAGFSDFLAGAVRNDSQLLDSYVDGGGVARVEAFALTSHAFVPVSSKGEFTRASIAVSLWGTWKNALGGGLSGLNTLWAAARSTTAYADGTGEFEQATLGCFPTYLQGVATRVTSPTWNTILGELALESVPNPNAAYFAGTALWQTTAVPFSASGSLQTYAPSLNIYYDRNQSQAWRFTHLGGARTITMTPTGGQDFYLELIGPGGLVSGSYQNAGNTRVLTFSSLPAGVYVARVRVGVTSATGSYSYAISVN